MFSKIALFATASMALLVAAAPAPGGVQNSCNTGEIQCCNQLFAASSSQGSILLGLIGVVVGSVTGQVGANCSPLSVIGVGGNSCTQQPVCCTDNKFNGLVAVGCSPINLGA